MPAGQRKTSRPTTPLRRIERGSLSALSQSRSGADDAFPLDALEVAFAELSDSFSDFAANMQQITELGQSISNFNESFASFLYGLNVNAFCVDFPEAPVAESFRRWAERQAHWQAQYKRENAENTFLTTDDSFVERPPPRQSLSGNTATRGSATRGRGRGGKTRGGG